MNTEGKETPPENGHCSFKITLRSQNATVMRTNFHGLAIDNALVRLDFDKLLCGKIRSFDETKPSCGGLYQN